VHKSAHKTKKSKRTKHDESNVNLRKKRDQRGAKKNNKIKIVGPCKK